MINNDSNSAHGPECGGGVLLVFPGKYGTHNSQVPLSLVHIASPLQHAGYGVKILDMRLEDYQAFNIGDPVFVGISCMSGLQIRYALEFAEHVKAENGSVPVVWGGVHPTLLPEQTIVNPNVDVLVRGEGETTVVQLADALAKRQSLDSVPSITYKVKNEVRSNPQGKPVDLDTIPIDLPYDLLRLDEYPAFKAGRFHLQTSRGCPHSCGFCYNSVFNNCRWRGKSANRVLEEIEYIKGKYPHVKIIDPIDDNFFAVRARVEEFCRGLLKRDLDIAWRANCRFDYVSAYNRDFVGLLEKSRCMELDFGAESGSPRILKLINKGVTPEQMTDTVLKLKNWAPSIEPYASWISGLPTETYDDLKMTFDLMDKMVEINEKTQHFGVFVYTPFPSPILSELGAQFEPAQSLEKWGNVDVFHYSPSWHPKKYVSKLHTISAVTRYAFFPASRMKERNLAYRFAYGTLNSMAKYRWKHRYFSFPLEMRLVDSIARRFRGYV